MTKYLSILFAVLLAGCATTLRPGADPVVVNAERLELSAQGTIQFMLQTDHLDRGFWRTNAPAFHSFCEALRVPVAYQVTNTLPRWRVALLTLDDAKQEYRAARSASNTLASAQLAVQSLLTQANAWLVIVTNRPHVLLLTQ